MRYERPLVSEHLVKDPHRGRPSPTESKLSHMSQPVPMKAAPKPAKPQPKQAKQPAGDDYFSSMFAKKTPEPKQDSIGDKMMQ